MNNSKSLILIYSSVFLIIGLITVYLPAWLNKELNLDVRLISLVLGATSIVKAFSNLLLISQIKKPKYLKSILFLISFLLFISYIAITFLLYLNSKDTVIYLIIFSLVLFSPVMPIIENINNNINQDFNKNYGKIRLSGSIAFLLSVFLVGLFIDKYSLALFPFIFLFLVLLFFFQFFFYQENIQMKVNI